MQYALLGICCFAGGYAIGKYINEKKKKKIISKCEQECDKFRQYYDVLNKWMQNVIDGYEMQRFFEDRGIKKIAIYGMGELGNRLIEFLESTDIQVLYGIDKNPAAISEIEVRGFNEYDFFDDVDCIVISAVNFYESIKKELIEKSNCEIYSLEDIIYGL